MNKTRYLTKSRFKLALECPTKLFYTGKAEYANQTLENSFLMALAEGGFQVGELAKLYFPGGHEITSLDHDVAVKLTDELLQRENVIIYEAAIRTDSLFVRADILKKKGNYIELIEVKAKSFDSEESSPFISNKGSIKTTWKSYLYDVAFQKYVTEQAFPEFSVHGFLMLVNKNSLCPSDGLNQKFSIVKDNSGRKMASVSENITDEDLSIKLLCQIDIDDICQKITNELISFLGEKINFSDWVSYLAGCYQADTKIAPSLSSNCKGCEFVTTINDKTIGLKSGFQECWSGKLEWEEEDFEQSSVLDLWNYRKKDQLIEDGCFKLSDIRKEDISPKEDGKSGLSVSERQWLQVSREQESNSNLWLDKDSLRYEMSKWRYPLHFIDFETTMVAIPFNKGRRPYEGIAFQFSHHTVDQNGKVAHKTEFLNTQSGKFPNYEFVRHLMDALNQDEGNIFRYSPHENTFLNIIYRQLLEDICDIPNKTDMLNFIKSITKSTNNSVEKWEGNRNMIDLWELVKRYYYDPRTRGANSIKNILPSVMNRSTKLKEKYSRPIYGAQNGIPSLNYQDWQWVQFDGDMVIDPYKLLPKMFQDVPDREFNILSEGDELREGGAAMTAYARMQFEEMSDYEQEEIHRALLKYCELDTMAMVMLFEGWQDLISN